MTDYITLAAEKLGVEVDDILDSNVYPDVIAVVVDYGIAGGKKFYLPLSELNELAIPDDETAADELEIARLPYRELQELAKEFGIPANQKHDTLVAGLEAVFIMAEDEEE